MSSFVGLRETTWNDMSDHVVHITKDYDGTPAFENLLKILKDQIIEARTLFGLAKDRAPDPDSQKAVCFTEIPLTEIKRVAKRRSGFGIAFSKQYAVMMGANPIWYAYKNHIPAESIRYLIELAIGRGDKDDPIFKISPFVDAPGTYNGSPYLFEWEREWRKQGDFKFYTDDVEFIILPEEHHEGAKRMFGGLKRYPSLGPAYDVPLIDALWKRKKIRKILNDAAGN